MSYAKVPTVLDVMLLTAVVDNRKLIEELSDEVGVVRSKVEKIVSFLKSRVSCFDVRNRLQGLPVLRY